MAMSIVHRATGIALYAGTILLVVWLAAAAIGGATLDVVEAVYGSWFGQIVLFGYTWALFHHMLGGLRHFIWDSGRAFDPAGREMLARVNLIGSVALTIIAWVLFVWVKG